MVDKFSRGTDLSNHSFFMSRRFLSYTVCYNVHYQKKKFQCKEAFYRLNLLYTVNISTFMSQFGAGPFF